MWKKNYCVRHLKLRWYVNCISIKNKILNYFLVHFTHYFNLIPETYRVNTLQKMTLQIKNFQYCTFWFWLMFRSIWEQGSIKESFTSVVYFVFLFISTEWLQLKADITLAGKNKLAFSVDKNNTFCLFNNFDFHIIFLFWNSKFIKIICISHNAKDLKVTSFRKYRSTKNAF